MSAALRDHVEGAAVNTKLLLSPADTVTAEWSHFIALVFGESDWSRGWIRRRTFTRRFLQTLQPLLGPWYTIVQPLVFEEEKLHKGLRDPQGHKLVFL
jgi:hypothetical protein